MAGADYLDCFDCGVRLLYDGTQRLRDDLEETYGEGYEILCPKCVKRLKKKLVKIDKKKRR
jgi:hypothetical protein